MPEGDSLRRVADVFSELFVGSRCQVTSPKGTCLDVAELVSGEIMTDADAFGKNLILVFGSAEEAKYLRIHLGLFGKVKIPKGSIDLKEGNGYRIGGVVREEINHQDLDREKVNLEVVSENGAVAYILNPLVCKVLGGAELLSFLGTLGPDPLSPIEEEAQERAETFVSNLQGTNRELSEVLLDQGIVAGPGNIIRAEVLFNLGLNPHRPANSLSVDNTYALWNELIWVMSKAVKDGYLTTSVYSRGGTSCPACGTSVLRERVNGRTLHWCEVCQSE